MLQIHVQPGVALKHAKEGTETSAFWFAVGGKQSITSKKVTNDIVRDPHLFTLSFNKGNISCDFTYLYNCYKIVSLFTDI
jgi:gelsolin